MFPDLCEVLDVDGIAGLLFSTLPLPLVFKYPIVRCKNRKYMKLPQNSKEKISDEELFIKTILKFGFGY